MLGFVKYIYELLPKDLLTFLRYVPDNVLFGSHFERASRGIDTNRALLADSLLSVLNYARDNTAFWSKLIPMNLCKNDVWMVLDELPTISSSDLVNGLDRFLSKRFGRSNSYVTTTGGTGRNPTTIVLSNESYTYEWAHMLHIWGTMGYSRQHNRKLTLRGKIVRGKKLFEYNPIYNEIVVDMFKLNSGNFRAFYDSIRRIKIDYIHAYPSLLREFKDYLDLYQINYPLKGIMLGSEGIELEEKRSFARHFRCPVISWYGQSEKVVLAADFACDNRFKVLTSYGYPSLCDDENGVGEIVGTTFVNRALPLIKYRTGDYGSLEITDNAMFISNIIGRWGKDFVYSKNGKKIPTTAINLHGPVQDQVLHYQIHQRTVGTLLIKILPKQVSELTEDGLISAFKKELGDKLKDFEVHYIVIRNEEEIIKSERGKVILLIQELDSRGTESKLETT